MLNKLSDPHNKQSLTGRLALISEILRNLNQTEMTQFEAIMSFAIKQLSTNVNRVKELAYAVLVNLYSISPQETRVIVETSALVRAP